MIFGERETDIIDYLQSFYASDEQRIAMFPSPTPELEAIVDMVCNPMEWKWCDSSGKSAPPPDFYSDEFRLMMDVMRVNDHEQKGKKGKLHNPSMAHERDMYKELEQSGILEYFPQATVFLTGDTQLPTYVDHNYSLYRNCFKRVVSKHVDSISTYQKNHPGYKVIFLVFDESSAYFEADTTVDPMRQIREVEEMVGRPHYYYLDEAFLEAFIDNGIDYLFWFAPYKLFENIMPPLKLPGLCVYDLSKKHEYGMKYNGSKMISVEA